MTPATIASMEDLRAIERVGLRSWMRFDQVLDALADVAARFSDRPALTALAAADDPSPRRWTYTDLLSEIRRSANQFRECAGAAEPRVALLLPPVPEAWFALWGAETAGVACPINHALTDDHLVALLNAAGVNMVVTLVPGHAAGDIGARVLRLRGLCTALKTVLSVGGAVEGTLDFCAARARHDGAALGFTPPAGPDRVAALFHTGGTTGLPKLAQHTHANQLHAAWGAARLYDASERDVILNGFPLFHVAGAFVYGLSLLLSGAEIVLPPPAGWRDAAFVAKAWPLIRTHGVTLLAMVPTVMTALLAAPRNDGDGGDGGEGGEGGDAAAVRLGLTGGSPLPTELAARFEREIGVPVRNILGMTECAGVIAIEPARAPRTAGSCGLPLPFSEVVKAADGVLRLRGPNVGPGYSDASRNAGSFEDGGWLISGDIGHVDAAGRVFVTGRAKDVIIRGAHNIDPGAVEEALLRHPQVALAAVVGEPDEYAGELPVAFVVAKPGATLDVAELLAAAAPHIAERAAVPKRISLLPALPLTAIGKVYKPALRLQAAERVIGERLARAGLSARVAVRGEDRGGRLVLCFVAGERAGEREGEDEAEGRGPAALQALEPSLRALMAGFALAWEIA
ncbi:MAG: AMP-binding protein [Rhizobacter sp.]|nr:AMP-binding protein [Rhizobacter sp.]